MVEQGCLNCKWVGSNEDFITGIGSPDLAAQSLGWEHVFMSEVDPRASAVLAHRYVWQLDRLSCDQMDSVPN